MQFEVDPAALERRRLEALLAYDILDTDPEAQFDDLVKLAAAVCNTPMAAVSLIDRDRQWFKAELNVGARETPRSMAFCQHALSAPQLMVVPDSLLDERFVDNPLVTGPPHIRFYAGAVLRTPTGEAIGTVCVLGTEPRPDGLSAKEADLLIGIARQAMSQLELRRALKAAGEERAARAGADVRLQSALEAAEAVGAWMWEIKTDKVYADARFAEFFHIDPGIAAEGAPLSAFMDGIEEADRMEVAAAVQQALETGEPFEEEYRLRPASAGKEPRWVLAKGRVIFDAEGLPDRFPGAVVDITARRRSEDMVRSASVALQVALKAANLGRWDHNPATGARFYDDRLREMFGMAAGDELDLAATLAYIHPDDRARLLQATRASLDPGRTGGFAETFRVRAKAGGWRWIEANGQSFFEFGRCTRFTGVMQDVTERVAADRESQEAALRLQLALDAGDVGTWSFNPVTQSVKWDARTYELMGVPEGAPVSFGVDFIGRLHPEDRDAALQVVSEATVGREYADERRVRLPDGKDRWISVRGRRAPGENEFIGTLRDITADKAMDAQRRLLAEELRHRMKNLLAMVQSIASQTLRTVERREDASRIFSERLVALAATVDALTERTWSATPMDKLVDGALLPHTGGGARILREGPPIDLAPKQALALTLAFHELATNAAKYGALSKPEGQVKLTWHVLGEGDQARLRIEWREEGGPPVEPPKRRSFGSRLIETNVAQELGGSAKLHFEPAGVVWVAEAPLATMTA